MRPDGPRESIVGPDSGPEAPFPLKLSGEVIKGFGRGSKEVRTFPLSSLSLQLGSPFHFICFELGAFLSEC